LTGSGIFIAGTDTGVGKTFVTAGIVRALRARGTDAMPFKPFCCGDRADAEILSAATDHAITIDQVNPVWFRSPASPLAASIMENRVIDLDVVRGRFTSLRRAHPFVVVEGVGGWRVPVTRHCCMDDLAKGFDLPVLLIAANRLGCLNHTLLTHDAIGSAGLPCVGVVLNDCKPNTDDVTTATNRRMLETFLDVPVFSVTHGQGQRLDHVVDLVSAC
jgi:dethiobiotin synthetase